jgi:hypothetical protein
MSIVACADSATARSTKSDRGQPRHRERSMPRVLEDGSPPKRRLPLASREKGKLAVHGGVYHLATGHVALFDV